MAYWAKVLEFEGMESWISAAALTKNGDIVVAGGVRPKEKKTKWSGLVARLDGEGNIKWQKTYGGYGDNEADAVAIAPNGDIIVAGGTESFGEGKNAWILRILPDGNLPGCDFCMDSDAVVTDTNAKIHNTACEVLSGVRKYQVEVGVKKKRKEWRTERVSPEVTDSNAEVRARKVRVKTLIEIKADINGLKKELNGALSLSPPADRGDGVNPQVLR